MDFSILILCIIDWFTNKSIYLNINMASFVCSYILSISSLLISSLLSIFHLPCWEPCLIKPKHWQTKYCNHSISEVEIKKTSPKNIVQDSECDRLYKTFCVILLCYALNGDCFVISITFYCVSTLFQDILTIFDTIFRLQTKQKEYKLRACIVLIVKWNNIHLYVLVFTEFNNWVVGDISRYKFRSAVMSSKRIR